jgi:serine phosphatase RsbU (regulator of sigma subunit)
MPLPIGSTLSVGGRTLKHEWRTRTEIEHSDYLDRDLQKAASYVRAQLPAPWSDGPIRTDWIYEPSAKLGGDAFGYGVLSQDVYVCYLVDVAGHGADSAMHAVAIMNQLRSGSLPNTDMTRPELVLSSLNELFQMDDHGGLYFTIWYGVYHARTRRLDFASGGHHPAYLVPAERQSALPLRTRNPMIGAKSAVDFAEESVTLPAGASLYLFSDGVFEIVDTAGMQWSVEHFVDLVLEPRVDGLSEPERLHRTVIGKARPDTLDDDFSLVILNFD